MLIKYVRGFTTMITPVMTRVSGHDVKQWLTLTTCRSGCCKREDTTKKNRL